MGLFDKIKSTFASSNGTITPPAATFATRPDTVYAPISGVLVSLKEVNDEVISAGLLGDGYGILPTGAGVLYAPVSGRIGATTVTNHSIAIRTEEGMEVLIHIGIGTVNMGGKGFTRLVEANDEVRAGQPLMTFSVDAIKLAGYDEVVACVISNPDAYARIDHVGESGTLLGGRPLVKIGDPLLVARK
ncbi:PTS sugar transporter subunit IIA [Olsenella profusa]|uniref:PTS glucose transporter subunit IIA n=1 Tax=Olsenella profusa TaxID=138595 RepID=A0ABS2F2M7_9ACTN|nr:PTS glucose transporter subunit IIA [Olsenella profusa]MBM6775244.1 PTS glucose transporter subunit IIA [Olsenella profusa]